MPIKELYRVIKCRFRSLSEEDFIDIITRMQILGKVEIENGMVRVK